MTMTRGGAEKSSCAYMITAQTTLKGKNEKPLRAIVCFWSCWAEPETGQTQLKAAVRHFLSFSVGFRKTKAVSAFSALLMLVCQHICACPGVRLLCGPGVSVPTGSVSIFQLYPPPL